VAISNSASPEIIWWLGGPEEEEEEDPSFQLHKLITRYVTHISD